MRSEEFDKRIQQKLEKLDPVFNEQDWIRLSQKMKAQKSPALFSKRIGLILFLLFLVLFGTWMSFRCLAPAPNSKNEDRFIKEQIPPRIAGATDYKIKGITNDHSNESPNAINSIVNSESGLNVQTRHQIHDKNSKNSITGIHSGFTNSNLAKKNLSDNQSNLNESNQAERSTAIEISQLNKNTSIVNTVSNEAKASSQDNNSNVELVSQNPESISIQRSAEVEPIKVNDITEISMLHKPALSKHLKPLAGLKPNKWILGITELATANHLNSGLGFEIKTNKNISFGSGIVFQKYYLQNYIDQNAFTATNEADFKDLIRPRDSKSASFSNIQIKSMDVLLPLSLKYYYPLNTTYSLFASASMQLTLYSKTSLDFEYLSYSTNTKMKEVNFDQSSNSATLINHFVIGAGIQREFRHFNFQTSFLLQKNNNNQPQITKLEIAGQVGVFYKL